MDIDINCDVGEGLGNEKYIMPRINSCNISCGAHAGSVAVIDEVLALAKKHQVKVGAHPSYPDREHFGRKRMQISNEELKTSLVAQLQLFQERCKLQAIPIHHVKPHGALYNVAAVDEDIARIVIESVQAVFKNIKIYVPYTSVIANLAQEMGCPIAYEVFADRNYNTDLTLVARNHPNAVIMDPQAVRRHVLRMSKGKVKTIDGIEKSIQADTFCVHGDNKNVLQILKALKEG